MAVLVLALLLCGCVPFGDDSHRDPFPGRIRLRAGEWAMPFPDKVQVGMFPDGGGRLQARFAGARGCADEAIHRGSVLSCAGWIVAVLSVDGGGCLLAPVSGPGTVAAKLVPRGTVRLSGFSSAFYEAGDRVVRIFDGGPDGGGGRIGVAVMEEAGTGRMVFGTTRFSSRLPVSTFLGRMVRLSFGDDGVFAAMEMVG